MGAICGYAGHGDGDLLDRFLGRLAHRGRGGAGKVVGEGFGLAENHRDRDPEPEGAPGGDRRGRVRASADGRVVAVLDGVLLNRAALREALDGAGVAARAGDDAEIVADGFMAFGEALFPRLDGAFTAAIHAGDALYLARDALGEKALYYTEHRGSLLFASEIKAFLASEGFVAEPDAGSLVKLLVFSFIPGAASMFRGVRELLPGNFVCYRGPGTTRAVTYW